MTPRTDDPIGDMAKGAWLYAWALCLFGFYLTVIECSPTRNR